MAKVPVIPILSSPEDEAVGVPSSHKLSSKYAIENSPSIERKKRKRLKRRNETPESPRSSKKTRLIKLRVPGSKDPKKGSPELITLSPIASLPLAHRPSHPFVKTSTFHAERKAVESETEEPPMFSGRNSEDEEPAATVEAGGFYSDDDPMASTSHKRNPFAGQISKIPEQAIEDRSSPDLSTQPAQKLEPSTYVPGKETLADDDNCYISKAAFNLLTSRHVTLQHMVTTFIDSVNDLKTTSDGDRDVRDGILAEAKSLQMGIKAVSHAAFELPYANRTGAAARAAADKTLRTIEKFNEKKRIDAEAKAAAAAQQVEKEEPEMVEHDDSDVGGEVEGEEEEDGCEEQTADTDGKPMDESG
ncbi:hypothetical protein COL5a_004711 [Colletotrichum fioriniae]|nr:hypothetical protein COL5a_004711 [Colletotrichum fioriniae]